MIITCDKLCEYICIIFVRLCFFFTKKWNAIQLNLYVNSRATLIDPFFIHTFYTILLLCQGIYWFYSIYEKYCCEELICLTKNSKPQNTESLFE